MENRSVKSKINHTSIQKSILRVAVGTIPILLIPFIAMQFTDEVNWDEYDFIIMGVLLFGAGLTYELIVKKIRSRERRLAVGFVLAAAFLYIWAELAVGISTNWGG